MSDGSASGMSFPQKVHTEDEDFVIELDENHMAGQHDGYGMDDRSRCKRRKRCGQCGPCQVKENCMKCHFCIRKDVLKQTCIYRKCVYLRSKPKPYSRSHQSPQGRISPQRDMMQTAPVVKSPPSCQTPLGGMPFSDTGMPMPEPRQENHPFFPAQLPQQSQVTAQQNNGYVSPPNPVLDNRTPSLPNHTAGTNMNMQISASPHMHSNATSPVQKMQDASSPPLGPHPINSPMGHSSIPGIPAPVSSCPSITPHMSSMPHMGHAGPVFSPIMSSSSLPGITPSIPPISALPNMPGVNERTINEFRPPDQFSLTPHHPHPHYPSVHPHMTHRDPSLFRDPSRMPHMNFNTPNHMDTFSRGPNDSSCMYHPALPYTMPGHFQPSGPSFIPGTADMNPFRSNFLNTFPPGYSYPPDRYREGFGSLPFSRLGMSASPAFPQYPGQGYGMGNSFSQQYYNSQHGCPKNVSRPPVSPSTDDVKVIQEGYKNNENNAIKSKTPVNLCSPRSDMSEMCTPHSAESDFCSPRMDDTDGLNKERNSIVMSEDSFLSPSYPDMSRTGFGDYSPRMDHLKVWSDYYLQKTFGRSDLGFKSRNESVSNPTLRPPLWEPWKIPPWYSPRREDVRSRTSSSTMSSDFECEVISIDDHQMNALIRSDGCNSIEIEFNNSSLSSSDDSSPRKLPSTASSMNDFLSPAKNNCFEPIDKLQIMETRSLFSPWHNISPKKTTINKYGASGIHEGLLKISPTNVQENRQISGKPSLPLKQTKVHFKGSVCIKQDLGDEGILHLELPGHKVTIEDAVLSEELVRQCSNIAELKEFIRNKDGVKLTTDPLQISV